MELLFDTPNIEEIKKYSHFYLITGITSNPSILKAEGKIEFFKHLREIRSIIGREKILHVQILEAACEGMLAEVDAILNNVNHQVYIKITTTEQGLKSDDGVKSQEY